MDFMYFYKSSGGLILLGNTLVCKKVDYYHVATFQLHVPTAPYMKPHSSKTAAFGSATIPAQSGAALTMNMIDELPGCSGNPATRITRDPVLEGLIRTEGTVLCFHSQELPLSWPVNYPSRPVFYLSTARWGRAEDKKIHCLYLKF